MRKKLQAAMIVMMFVAVCMLSGCGSDSGKTVVTIQHSEKLENVEKFVEEQLPDIDLQWERVVAGDFNDNMVRQIKAGKGPDLVVSTQPAYEESKSHVLPLGGYSFSSQYESTSINNLSLDGMVYYLPLPGQYYGYVVNKTLFDEADMELPTTNEELIEDLKWFKEEGIGVTDTGHVFGFGTKEETDTGNYLVECMVPDFLSTAEGIHWLAEFEEKNATMAGTWEPAFDLLNTIVENDLMSVTTYTKEGNAPDNHIFLSEGDIVAVYGSSSYAQRCMELNSEAVAAGTAEEYEYVMLPFMGEGDTANWTISMPASYIGINIGLQDDEEKLDACCRVLEQLSTQGGQEALMQDTATENSYLKGFENKEASVAGLEETIVGGYVYNVKFPGKVIEYLGIQGEDFLAGKKTVEECLIAVDDYYISGSAEAAEDMEVVGSVAEDMIFKDYNTRLGETTIGNLVADSVAALSGADIAVVNGGGIRASLYEGEVKNLDLEAVCPFDNQIVVVEMSGKVLRQMLRNGVSGLAASEDIPEGRFLQVSGIYYTFDSSKSKNKRLVDVTLADGTAIKNDKTYKVAINNYMAGKNGYMEGNGDGYTMLNLYSDEIAKAEGVKLVEENMGTYKDALRHYFKEHEGSAVKTELEGRITDVAKDKD
ncbi:MAG: extracellular solute-binding protein [Bacillota bacterium]|nr:extracellular solute-binding protein [Bacillota bacterium]